MAPQPDPVELRLSRLENIILALTQQPQQDIDGVVNATTAGPQQQGMSPQLLQTLLPMLMQGMGEDKPPDPFVEAMKLKALAGMDLQNSLVETIIKNMALGAAKNVLTQQ